LLAPAASLVLAAFVASTGWKDVGGPRAPAVSAVLGLALVAALAYLPYKAMRSEPQRDYLAAARSVWRYIPRGQTVMGSQIYWLGSPSWHYLSWEQLVYYQRYAPGGNLEKAFRALHPKYLILDATTDLFLLDPGWVMTSYGGSLQLSKPEMQQFISWHARQIASFNTAISGRVRIYQIYR
jgi:hypothetical protein